MINMRKIILLSLFLIGPNAYSGTITTTISQVGAATNEFGMLVLETSILQEKLPECAKGIQSSDRVLSWRKSGVNEAHGKDLLSLATTGLISNKRLSISFSNAECGLWGTRPLIQRIDLVK